MKNLTSLFLGAAMTAATVTFSTITAAPALAGILVGGSSIGLDGTAIFPEDEGASPDNTTLGFTSNEVEDASFSFESLLGWESDGDTAPYPIIKTLDLTRISTPEEDGLFTKTEYSFDSESPFIDFGEVDLDLGTGSQSLTFVLDEGTLTRSYMSETLFIEATMNGITGKFIYGGENVAAGFFSASRAGNADTYQMTLTVAESVPEPATLFGLGVVTVGLVASRRQSKKNS